MAAITATNAFALKHPLTYRTTQTARTSSVPSRHVVTSKQQSKMLPAATAAATVAAAVAEGIVSPFAHAAPTEVTRVAWGFDGNFGTGEIVVGINLLAYLIYLAVVGGVIKIPGVTPERDESKKLSKRGRSLHLMSAECRGLHRVLILVPHCCDTTLRRCVCPWTNDSFGR